MSFCIQFSWHYVSAGQKLIDGPVTLPFKDGPRNFTYFFHNLCRNFSCLLQKVQESYDKKQEQLRSNKLGQYDMF